MTANTYCSLMPCVLAGCLCINGCSSGSGSANGASGGAQLTDAGAPAGATTRAAAGGQTSTDAAGGANTSGGKSMSGGRGATEIGGSAGKSTICTGGSAAGGAATGGVAAGGVIAVCVPGGACPKPGASCTDSSGTICTCVGPTGSSYITCDTTTASGGSTSNGSGGGGTVGNGGSSAKGGGGNSGGTTSAPGQGVPCAGASPWTTAAATTSITVDAGLRGARWDRFYEKCVASDHANTVLSTAWGRNIQNALKKGHDQAGFQYVRFHGILNSDVGVYTENNGLPVYNWTRFDLIFDSIVAAGMRAIFEVGFMPPTLSSGTTTLHWYNGAPANINPPKDWTKWMNLMTEIVKHLEGRYGVEEIRNNWYFEVWNESSWMYSLGEGGYNELFGYTARGLFAGDPQLKVGGPAASAASSPGQIRSLVSYAKTNSLKLSFVSYHRYGNDGAVNNRADANGMSTFHSSLMSTIKGTGFTGEVLNDEWGASYDADVSRDSEVSASFIAKTIHLIGTNATTAPPVMYGYWTISDLYEEFNSGGALAYREGNYGLMLKGDPSIPASFDVAKPAFNAFRLLHMLGDMTLSTTGGTTADGVNAVATVSSGNTSVQVLVYNHVTGGTADSSRSQLVKVTVNDLPFSTSRLDVRHYVLDRTHSNSYRSWVSLGKPQKPTAAQWSTISNAAELCYYSTTAAVAGNSWTVTFPQNTYGVSLLVLTPGS